MLIIKRLISSLGCGCMLFLLLSIGTLITGAGILGGIAGVKNPENPEEAGKVAGENFAHDYGLIIFLGSLCVAGALGFWLSFGGVFPW